MSFSARLKKTALPFLVLSITIVLPSFAQEDPTSDFFTTSDQVKLHYIEAGQGQAVLLIPGWLMPVDIWELQIRELSKDYHVIALDPRSQGQSDMTKTGNDPLRRSKDIQELLDYLHLNSVVLVGWSLGAFDSLAYLRQFGPDKIYAMVLVDSPLGTASGQAPTKRGAFLKLLENDRAEANQRYVWSLFKKSPPKGLSKSLIQSAALIPTNIALASLDNTMPGDIWGPGYPALRQVPILYAVTPKYTTQAAYLMQIDPKAQVEIFPTAGHALFVDEAKHFNSLVRGFLRKASLYPGGLPNTNRAHPAPLAVSPTAPTVSTTPIVSPQATSVTSPVSTPLPVETLTPLPAAPLVPTNSPTVEITPLPSPPISVTDTMTCTPLATTTPIVLITPKETPALSSELTLTPSPARILIQASKVTPTPPASIGNWLSKTMAKLRGEPAIPSPRVTASPTEVPRLESPHQTYLNASAIQDGYFVTSDHVKLHYLETGQGLPLVFIPGWLLPAEIWKPQLDGLSDDFRVIALDPRSQGDSDMTTKGDEPIRQAQDIQELLDHLQLSSVVLVGWSHGGFQLLAYMGQFGTDRLYAAALVDSALGASSNAISSAPRARFLEQFQKDRINATKGFVWGLFKKHPPMDFYRRLITAAQRTPTDIALALMNNAFPGDSYQPNLPTMRQIPLLYAVTPKYTTQAAYLTSVDPLARVEFFKSSGHALFYDEADHFNTVMRDFLRQAALYPAGWAHPAPKSGADGQVPAHSYLENPK